MNNAQSPEDIPKLFVENWTQQAGFNGSTF
jgi:hypothetical protein